MPRTYSLYAAKAKLSEIVRRVREGDIVTISYRGKPVAEIRPIPKAKQTLDERIRELEERGIITRQEISHVLAAGYLQGADACT